MIILASTSPRRIEILERLGLSFKAISPTFDESSYRIINPLHIPVEFAYKKAISINKDYPNDLVIGFDTIVLHRGKVLGKPESPDEAVEFLKRMSGTTHEVITGVSIVCKTNNIICNFTDISRVKFKILTRATILKYFEKVNPLDKAGAYAIQEYGDMIIEKFHGSMDNIIGLPTEKLLKALNNIQNVFGISLNKEIFPASDKDYPRLLVIWEKSVRVTHNFLKESDIQFIKPFVLKSFPIVKLFVFKNESGKISGFVGLADNKIEMLFVDSDCRGKGIGKKLALYAIDNLDATKLDVNEQNHQAVEFYKHIGFKIEGRSELDRMGNPFPLLHMNLKSKRLSTFNLRISEISRSRRQARTLPVPKLPKKSSSEK